MLQLKKKKCFGFAHIIYNLKTEKLYPQVTLRKFSCNNFTMSVLIAFEYKLYIQFLLYEIQNLVMNEKALHIFPDSVLDKVNKNSEIEIFTLHSLQ